ncbi:MAG: tRNA lysidine(34) synthetase TilS [Burkholderiales bacterium]
MDALATQVAAVLRQHASRDQHLLVGLSGGIDSVVLLHVLARGLRWPSSRLSAIHVNHQLSPNAGRWAAFCKRLCARLGVPLHVRQVEVRRGNSTEAAARDARYRAYSGMQSDRVVLAHNRDDQAETLLLQLLRGAGPRGLAAMAVMRPAAGTMPAVLRPLLEVPRTEIERYARRHRLNWVEDESNEDRTYLRNFLRHDVLPLLESRVPGSGATLARAARHQAEASGLLDVLAQRDVGRLAAGQPLPLGKLARLDPARARNALRWFLRRNGVTMPDADRLEEALRQSVAARRDAQVCVDLGGVGLRRFRDALYLVRPLPPLPPDWQLVWDGGVLPLPGLGGTLRLVRRKGRGIAAHWLQGGALTVRVRRGGESLRPQADSRARTVRNLLQEAALPPWNRERLPFIWLDDRLVAVPGLGIAAEYQVHRTAMGLCPEWEWT